LSCVRRGSYSRGPGNQLTGISAPPFFRCFRALCAGWQHRRILPTYKAPPQSVKESPAQFVG
jgi:hypothetical protein